MNPVTFIEILTEVKGSHRATKLHINWRGMTEEQIQTLAQRAVIAAVQQDYKAIGKAAEKEVVEASWFLDRTTPSPLREMPKIADLPEYLQGKRDKEEKSVKVLSAEGMIGNLTPQQKADLIELLKQEK